MKASTTLTNWMKAKYGKVPQDLDQHYDALTKELSSYGPINDVDQAAMVNHVANMGTQGRSVPTAQTAPANPSIHPGMQAILAKMQAHGSQLPAKLNKTLPRMDTGGVIPVGGSALVGDGPGAEPGPDAEIATNTGSGTVITPAVPQAPTPAGQSPTQNGSSSQLQDAYNVAAKVTGLSPQAAAQIYNPQQAMALYQKYVDATNAKPISRDMSNAVSYLGGPNSVNAQLSVNAVNDAKLKNDILGPTAAGQATFAAQQDQDRLDAPINAQAAQSAINLPTINSNNATTQSTNDLTQLGNQFALQNAKAANDATSDYSKGVISLATPFLKTLGISLPAGMSAAQFTNAFGGIPQVAALVKQYNEQQVAQQNANSNAQDAAARSKNADTDAARANSDMTGNTAANQTQAKNDADANTEAKGLVPAANTTISQLQDAYNTIRNTDATHFGKMAAAAANTRLSSADYALQQKLKGLQTNALANTAQATGGTAALRGQKIDLSVMSNSPSIEDTKEAALNKIKKMLDTAIKTKEAANNVVSYYGQKDATGKARNSLSGYNPEDQSTNVSAMNLQTGETFTIPRKRVADAAKSGLFLPGIQ